MKDKIFISGKKFLEKEILKLLRAQLRNIKMTEVDNIKSAEAVILVTGDSHTLDKRAAEVRDTKKPFFLMNSDPDEQGRFTLCLISGQASSPEQAAKWAWSILNEPEKWTMVEKPKEVK